MKDRTPTFEMPDLTQVENLLIERLGETTLKHDSPVICINRGRKPLLVTFDGNHITVPPGHFRTEYGAAQHMQKQQIVPGTRNLEEGGFVSWVSILGSDDGRVAIDTPAMCQPFSDEELQHFGEPIEGLSPEGRQNLVPMRVRDARAMSRSQGLGGGSMAPQVSVDQQASEAAKEAGEHVFEPPAESLTRQAEAEAATARARGDEGDSGGAPPSPRPMRSRQRR